jgi:hypothetical protein
MSSLLRAAAAIVVGVVVATSAGSAHEAKVKDFEFIHPWTREPPAKVKDVPVYMVLRNTGSTPDRILAASSPFAARGELRASKSDGGGQLQGIGVGAGETIELEPDGAHIMLLGLTEPLDGYQYFPLWLTFERAGRIEIEVYVEEPN